MQKTGAVLLGISPDTPKAQKKFQEKFDLPFTLLADADKKVAHAFGVMKEKIRADLKRYIHRHAERRPMIMPVIMEI